MTFEALFFHRIVTVERRPKWRCATPDAVVDKIPLACTKNRARDRCSTSPLRWLQPYVGPTLILCSPHSLPTLHPIREHFLPDKLLNCPDICMRPILGRSFDSPFRELIRPPTDGFPPYHFLDCMWESSSPLSPRCPTVCLPSSCIQPPMAR